MRVLHLGKFFAPFVGGIENFMLDLLPACSRLGVEQGCLVHESPGGVDGGHSGFDFLSAFRRVPMSAQLSYAPISPAFRAALAGMLDEFRPHLLHLHMPNTSAFWALFDRRARRIPWVVHWHSDAVGPGLGARLKLLYPVYRPFERAVLGRSAAVIATSPPYLASSTALSRYRAKCRVIPLGLEPARVELTGPGGDQRTDHDWRFEDKLKVLAVGRLSRYKGFGTLIRAAVEIDAVEVVIAGAGEQRRRLKRLLPETAADRIRLVGVLDDRARNRLLHGCDVFCLPSVNRAEAFGLSLVEAMAAGKPAIATRVPGSGMGWVVEHGRTGWLVEPGDVDALAGTLAGLVDDRGSLGAIGRAARSAFEARFRIDRVADEIEAVYRDVVS